MVIFNLEDYLFPILVLTFKTSTMESIKAHLDNIQSAIAAELEKAESAIFTAVAWFTDDHLMNILCEKASNGIAVDLIISDTEINENNSNLFERLKLSGGNIYKIGAADFTQGSLMHNKFVVIDYHTLITGSFNWTKQARRNEENILIIKDSPEIRKYLAKFYQMRETGEAMSGEEDEIIVSLSTDKVLVEKGETITLSWSVKNAMSVIIDCIGPVDANGKHEMIISNSKEINLSAINPFKQKAKTLFIEVVRDPEIFFQARNSSIVKGIVTELTWNVKFADNVSIEPGIGKVTNIGTKSIMPTENTVYTLTASGVKTKMSKSVSVVVYPIPELRLLTIPVPSMIRFEATLDQRNFQIPGMLNLTEVCKLSEISLPTLVQVNSKFPTVTPTLNDLKSVYHKSKRELLRGIEKHERDGKPSLFDRLKQLFNNK